MPSWELTERQLCDLELILNGGFFPLKGFFGKKDYGSVMDNMRLADGSFWPMPITVDVDDQFANSISNGYKITLRDHQGFALAVLSITDIWQPDIEKESQGVYGTMDETHFGVNYLFNIGHKNYVGGTLQGISLPHYYDYQDYRHTPAELKSIFEEKGWNKVVGFQTRNPLHKAHVEMTLQAAKELDANLLIHPVVGMTKPGDVDHYTRVRCYQHVLKKLTSFFILHN